MGDGVSQPLAWRGAVALAVAVLVLMTPPPTGATTGGTQNITVEVVPNDDLEDGQTVKVATGGYRPGRLIGVQQCPSPPGPNTEAPFTAEDCDPEADSSAGVSDYREGKADGSGSLTTEFLVRKQIRAAAGSAPIDCVRQRCAIVTFPADENDESEDYGYDDIAFRS